MVRNYDPDRPVPAELVERLLTHATRAPSAGFAQGWAFLVLEEAADRDLFWSATSPATVPAPGSAPGTVAGGGGPAAAGASRWLTGMRRAPLIVVPCANRSAYLDRYAEPDKGWTDRDPARWTAPYWHVDAGMAVLAMLYAAVDEGLGACFFGVPPDRISVVAAAYGVPDDQELVGVVSLGTPDGSGARSRRERRSADELVHRGHWRRVSHPIS
jgi:nitroreductase